MKKIQFYLRFHTQFGQSLYVTGNTDALGNYKLAKAFPLQYLNIECWYGTIELPAGSASNIQYSYFLKNPDGTIIEEGGIDRSVDISKQTSVDEFQAIDTWNDAGAYDNAFYTAPFQQVLLNEHKTSGKAKHAKQFTHVFKAKAPLLKKNEILCLMGSSLALGEWTIAGHVPMNPKGNWWVA